MRKNAAAVAAIAFALTASPVLAGVVITQEQTVNSQGGQHKSEQTIMIEGNKQKMISKDHQVVTDLDKGAMYSIDPANKSYIEIPFPPKGPMKAAVSHAAGAMTFKKAGTSRKVAGYACDDYVGTGSTMGGDYTVTECFSTAAPGAKEFNSFERLMMSKLKGTGMVPTGDLPAGVPLASDSTMKMNKINVPGLSADQQAKLQEMMKNRKPVTTSTVVTKIAEQKLAADTFSIPAGFTKREFTMPNLPGGLHKGPAAPAAPAAPAKP